MNEWDQTIFWEIHFVTVYVNQKISAECQVTQETMENGSLCVCVCYLLTDCQRKDNVHKRMEEKKANGEMSTYHSHWQLTTFTIIMCFSSIHNHWASILQ